MPSRARRLRHVEDDAAATEPHGADDLADRESGGVRHGLAFPDSIIDRRSGRAGAGTARGRAIIAVEGGEHGMDVGTLIGLTEVAVTGLLVLGALAFVLWFVTRLDRERHDGPSPRRRGRRR